MWLILLNLAHATPCPALVEDWTARLVSSDAVWKRPAGQITDALPPVLVDPVYDDQPVARQVLSLGDEVLVAHDGQRWRLSERGAPRITAQDGQVSLYRISDQQVLAVTALEGHRSGWTRVQIFDAEHPDSVYDQQVRGTVEPLVLDAQRQRVLVRTPLEARIVRVGESEPGGPTPPVDVALTRTSIVTAVTSGFTVVEGAPVLPCETVEAVIGTAPSTLATILDLGDPAQVRAVITSGGFADAHADEIILGSGAELVWLGEGLARGTLPGPALALALAPDGPRALWAVTPSSYEGDGIEQIPRPPDQIGASLLVRDGARLAERGRQVWDPQGGFVDRAALAGDRAVWALRGGAWAQRELSLRDGAALPTSAPATASTSAPRGDADGVVAKRFAQARSPVLGAARRCQGWGGAWYEEPVAVQFLGITATPTGSALATTCGVIWLDGAGEVLAQSDVHPPPSRPAGALQVRPAEVSWRQVARFDGPADAGDIALAADEAGLWIAAEGWLWRVAGGRPRRVARLPGPPLALVAGGEGPWLLSAGTGADTVGCYRLAHNALVAIEGFDAIPEAEPVRLVFGEDGPWLLRASGVYHWRNGVFSLAHAPPAPLIPDRLAVGRTGVALSVTGAAGEAAIIAWPSTDLSQRGEIVVASPEVQVGGRALQFPELAWRGDELLYLAVAGAARDGQRGLFSWTSADGVRPLLVVGERPADLRRIRDISDLVPGADALALMLGLDEYRVPFLLTRSALLPLLDPTASPKGLETGALYFDDGSVPGPEGQLWLIHQDPDDTIEVWAVQPRLGVTL